MDDFNANLLTKNAPTGPVAEHFGDYLGRGFFRVNPVMVLQTLSWME